MPDIRSSLFGTLAVKAGLATRGQVDECLKVQAEARAEGRPVPKLGELMATRGYLSGAQVQAIIRGDFAEPGQRFGELCVRMGFSTQEQVRQNLLEQGRRRHEGATIRLGTIMVRNGHLKTHQVPAVLLAQGLEMAECTKCRLMFNMDVNAPESARVCPRCGRELVMTTGFEELELPEAVEELPPPAGVEEVPSEAEEVTEKAEAVEKLPLEAEAPAEELPVYGEFRPLEKLGEDASGVLYRAEHTTTGEAAALRLIDIEKTRDRAFLDRFIAETKRGATLRHANIKKIIAAGRALGHFYYASEFLNGKSVRQLIEKEGRIPFRAATRITRAVAEGLKYAHSQGVFHGDIRPSAILVTPDGQVKLAEVGTAKNVRQNVERLAQIHGVTPFYMAPELGTADGTTTASTDVFGLGAVYYHMVTGKPPYEGNSPLQILMRMAEEEPLPASAVDAEIPAEGSRVIQRMMSPEPLERYMSMEEVIAELDRVLGLAPRVGPVSDLKYPTAEAVPEGISRRPASGVRRARPARPAARPGARPGARRRRAREPREIEGEEAPRAAKGTPAGTVIGLVLLFLFLAAAAVLIIYLLRTEPEPETPSPHVLPLPPALIA